MWKVDPVLVALAAAAGWLDAASYLRVHVFTANMTGNTVLLALAAGGWGQATIVGSLAAILAFVAGSFGGSALGGALASPSRAARVILLVELAALVAVALVWGAWRAESGAPAFAFIVLAAIAMGLQQAATEQLHPQPAASTTYMSGTVERIGAGLYEMLRGDPSRFMLNGGLWLAFLAAAFVVGRIAGTSNVVLGVVPLCIVTIGYVLALRSSRIGW